VLIQVIDNMKNKIEGEFEIFTKYEQYLEKFLKYKEVVQVLSKINETYTIPDIVSVISANYNNYTDASLMDLKLGMIIYKTIEQIRACKSEIEDNLDTLKTILYSDNPRNKNLLDFDIEEEIDKEEFHQFIIDKINRDGNLESLLAEKRKNDNIINNNKLKIKCDESLLLENFYCVKCRAKPKNVLSRNCKHLMACEDCILIIKICPKCGLDIDKYDKIYR
jgi:hypothetical protein